LNTSRTRRRAVTLIELVVAMGVALTLIAVGYGTYMVQGQNGRTTAMAQQFAQLATAMAAFQASSATGAYPTDAVNSAGSSHTGEASYDALVVDLASNLPATTAAAGLAASSWVFEAINSTIPATYTAVGQAIGGNGHYICADGLNGVGDLGTTNTSTAGVKCK